VLTASENGAPHAVQYRAELFLGCPHTVQKLMLVPYLPNTGGWLPLCIPFLVAIGT
jgi:hypothetical protein